MTQADALTILKMGHNVFLTGGAGSGKTYVLNAYIKYLRQHQVDVAITASTGIAATHLGGMTIHAWSGMGIREEVSDYDIDRMEEKKYLWDRYEKVRVLIIDEISMLSGTFLDNLDRICRSFKRSYEKPFGGIQIILCGDLFQLPPISGRASGDEEYGSSTDFVIFSSAWKNMGLAMCYLTEQHRQNDQKFLDILNAIRADNLEPHHHRDLYSRVRDYDENDFSNFTKLFTHNVDVDEMNDRELSKIDGEERLFIMTDTGKQNLIDNLKKSCLAPTRLRLKIGAEVMFVKNNFEKGYVNGTRGVVMDFDELDLPVVKTTDGEVITVNTETWALETDEGKVLASINQIPLRHAWAITVHKSQGMSLDAAVIDLSKSFSYGMGYVALSRVRSLDGLHLIGLSDQALLVDPRILIVDQELQDLSGRAERRLNEFSIEEIKNFQDSFIERSGGTLEISSSGNTKTYLKEQNAKPTHEVTVDLINEGQSLETVAERRGLTVGTLIGHLEKAKTLGLPLNIRHLRVDHELLDIVQEAVDSVGDEKLTPLKRYLERSGYDVSFTTLKLAKLFLRS